MRSGVYDTHTPTTPPLEGQSPGPHLQEARTKEEYHPKLPVNGSNYQYWPVLASMPKSGHHFASTATYWPVLADHPYGPPYQYLPASCSKQPVLSIPATGDMAYQYWPVRASTGPSGHGRGRVPSPVTAQYWPLLVFGCLRSRWRCHVYPSTGQYGPVTGICHTDFTLPPPCILHLPVTGQYWAVRASTGQ